MIKDRSLELTAKMLSNEPISEEDRKWLARRNAKYDLVCFLVKEALRDKQGMSVDNFHFSPSEGFMDVPTIDVVNEVIKTFVGISDGSVSCKVQTSPPETGKIKSAIPIDGVD